MEDSRNVIRFEEVMESEIEDIWDIFFPNKSERLLKRQIHDHREQTKPRRYLKFLTM